MATCQERERRNANPARNFPSDHLGEIALKCACTDASHPRELDMLLKFMGLRTYCACGNERECAILGRDCGENGQVEAAIRGALRGRFQEFEAVSPGIFGVEAA